jgi:hypothetical protein
VQIFDGVTGQLVKQFFAYDPKFTGGVNVAVADVNGDGFADVITGAGGGGGPHVKVFSGKDGSLLTQFFAFETTFHGGVRVAAADLNNDGLADIVTGAGGGGGPRVRVFNGKTRVPLAGVLGSFNAFADGFRGGVFVAAADVNGDGSADVVVGTGPGIAPKVTVFSGKDGSVLTNSQPYGANFLGGVRVGALDFGGAGQEDVLTIPGAGLVPQLRVLNGRTTNPDDTITALDPTFLGGAFVAGGDG